MQNNWIYHLDSTLLKFLAWRQVPVPRNIDVLLVEQEIIGDDRSAFVVVVAADEELTTLQAEHAGLEALMMLMTTSSFFIW
jgi:ATP-binding cassette, subfamily F, member 1